MRSPNESPGNSKVGEVDESDPSSQLNCSLITASPVYPHCAICLADPAAALAFLQSVHSRLANPTFQGDPEDLSKPFNPPPPPAAEAYALSHSAIAYAQLLNGDLPNSKASLEACEKILSGLDGIEPMVNASYYEVSADYYKVS